MTRIYILCTLMLLSLTFYGQEALYCKFSVKNQTPLRHKILAKPLVNKGKTTSPTIQKIVDEYFATPKSFFGDGNKRFNNANVWSQQEFFVPTKNQAEADVTITGTYKLLKETSVEEKAFAETNGAYANKIPFYELRAISKAELSVILNFKYKDGSLLTDTIYALKTFENKKGAKVKTLDELEEECISVLKSKLNEYFYFIERTELWYRFAKIKIKDKALKEEFKAANNLLKENKVMELGALYKKIYATEKSKEVAQCIGMCYELLGNYPKANEFYQQLPDFAIKVRMKHQMEVYEYLHKLGMELTLVEF